MSRQGKGDDPGRLGVTGEEGIGQVADFFIMLKINSSAAHSTTDGPAGVS